MSRQEDGALAAQVLEAAGLELVQRDARKAAAEAIALAEEQDELAAQMPGFLIQRCAARLEAQWRCGSHAQ